MELPRTFAIRERNHRIHSPLTPAKLALIGETIELRTGQTVLDLACGSGEMLCTWSRDHGIAGTGVNISTACLASADARAAELGVAGRVTFVHVDAGGFVSPSGAQPREQFADLPGLVASFGSLGWDLVEMVLADEDSWDRYVAAQWLAVRSWLDENPDDELAEDFRAELDTAPLHYVRYQRRYLGWGVFALMRR